MFYANAPQPSALQHVITAVLITAPLAGVVVAIAMLFGRGVSVTDLVLGVAFYAISGHGVTAGYHRMLTHRSFVARRATKIVLALAGSLAFEGAVTSWVALHRRHHAYTDVPGDPHSPHLSGGSLRERVSGAAHAHVGWLFCPQAVDLERWAPDVASDPDLVLIAKAFPVLCVVSLGAPTLLGWALAGTAAGALGGLVWGGLVRVFLLQHSTFAVNSACHLWGRRPFVTRSGDEARNFAPLAVLSMGENWHNLHHSLPRSARHGVRRHEWDSTARLIRILERLGLVTDVRWPSAELIEPRSRRAADGGGPGGDGPGEAELVGSAAGA